LLAIEFDFSIDRHMNDPGTSYSHISILKSNSKGILEADHFNELKSNSKPVNLANFLKPGLVSNAEIIIIFTISDQDLIIGVGVDGQAQLDV